LPYNNIPNLLGGYIVKFFALHRAVLAIAAAGLLASAPAGAWVETATKATAPAGASLLGAAAADQDLFVALSLKLQNSDALAQFLKDQHTPGSPSYGVLLTPAQFAASYAPSAQQAQAVADYLSSMGFTQVSVAPNRLLVMAHGTPAAAQAAFNTPIQRLSLLGKALFGNAAAAQVPESLADTVLAVHGLQNVFHVATGARAAAAGTAQGMKPQDFATAYDATGVPDATKATYAIFMDGDVTQVLTDLRTQETMNKLPQVPVQVIETDAKGTGTDGLDEWDLDSQSSSGIAGNAKNMIWYVESVLDLDANTLASINRWVTDDVATAANASWGECEDGAKSAGFLASADQLFMQAVAQGQTFFVSSGDNGFTCGAAVIPNGVPLGEPFQSYPSSSPWVASVGGTTLNTDGNFGYVGESAWTDGGGGISVEENAPDWQTGFVGRGLLPGLVGASKFRGCPDIAMSGSPDSGLITIVKGKPEQVGGTSLSSPLAVGAWARFQSLHGNKLGFAPPVLYALATAPAVPPVGFHDVTSGSNVGYRAAAGWDYATGLGSFDIAALAPLLGPVDSGSSSGGSSSSSGGSSDSGGGAFGVPVLLGLLFGAGLRRKQPRRAKLIQ
jgi:pseudomonalisin